MRRPSAALAAHCAAGVALALAGTALAQRVDVVPSIDAKVTWTTNANLQPDAAKESDFITTLTPGVAISYRAARASLNGSVTVPIIFYAQSEDRSEILPSANLVGNVEVLRDFFFIDAQATVSQSYLSPFASRPPSIENRTTNRYTSQTYSVSPYIRGQPTSLISYLVRNDNRWTKLSDTDLASDNAYTNTLTATINRQPTPFGWGADFFRSENDFDNEASERRMLARLRGVWQPDPQLQLFVTAGYEDNDFALNETKGSTYGGGFRWRPTERTTLDVTYEHRFFGASYNVGFEHRSPRTVWTVRASRDISSYPELLASVPAGVFVPALLNSLFASRIPDPAARLEFVRDFITDRGLPIFLAEPLRLYNTQSYLQEYAFASLGLVGVRNSVFFSLFHASSEPLFGLGEIVPPLIEAQNSNTQNGAGVSWSYQVSPISTLTSSVTYDRTNAKPPFDEKSNRLTVNVNFHRPLTPRTTMYAGARWQRADSTEDVADYTEAAVFAGINHRFR